MPVFNLRHFIAATAAITMGFTATASAQIRRPPSATETATTVSLRMESPEKMMGQYPPQMRKYLLQNLHIGLTEPKTGLKTRTMLVVHAVQIERGNVVDTCAFRPFPLPSGQTLILGDMFMPGEVFSPGSMQYPASGQTGAVRESAQRFVNGQRITNLSFLVILPIGTAATAQGVRF